MSRPYHVTRLLFGLQACLLMATVARSAENTDSQPIQVTGVVKPAAPSAEEAATVQSAGVLYKIVKDEKGKIVARDAGGKKVEIRGTVADKDGVKWVTVAWCALVE